MKQPKIKPTTGRIKDGLWTGVDMADYHKSPHISSSQVRLLIESPLTYRRKLDGAIAGDSTPAMAYGTAAHAAILENRFDAFHIQPATYGDGKKWNGRAAECQAWAEAHADKPVITSNQVQELSASAEYVRRHPKAGRLLAGGCAEVSIFAGRTKARADYMTISGTLATVVDLKTCSDASTEAFSREILNRGYHIQMAWYRRTIKAAGIPDFQCYFIGLQKGPLPLVNVWQLSMAALDLGDKEIERAMILLSQCEANNFWPEWADYDGTNTIEAIDLPAYAYQSGEPIELDMGGEAISV